MSANKDKKKKEKEENGPGNLPGSEGVLDHPGSILAVGQRRSRDQD